MAVESGIYTAFVSVILVSIIPGKTDEKSICWLRQRPIPPVFLHKKVQNAIHSSVDSGICSARASGLTASEEAKLHPSPSVSYLAFFQVDTPIP